jgi:hypothetical protein
MFDGGVTPALRVLLICLGVLRDVTVLALIAEPRWNVAFPTKVITSLGA